MKEYYPNSSIECISPIKQDMPIQIMAYKCPLCKELVSESSVISVCEKCYKGDTKITNLVLAAPDMYEALREILADRNSALARECGRKALAKAEGK